MAKSEKNKLRKRLGQFFALNPHATLETKGTKHVIVNPWNDASVTFEVTADNRKLVSALNKVLLPPSLVAMWHTDSKDLEIIYTPFRIDSAYYERSFDFHFVGKTYRAEFAKSSDRLLDIVAAFRPGGEPSASNYRNLDHFRYGLKYADKKFAKGIIGQPTCFWVRNIEWNEDFVVGLCRHLNFYMSFYDRLTPLIIILNPQKSKSQHIHKSRYLFDEFPKSISGAEVEPYLLMLWESAQEAQDPISELLYYYQILEYSAFYYLDYKTRSAINQILAMPHIIARPSTAAKQILDIFAEYRISDEAKIIAVVRQKVRPSLIWKEIDLNRAFFSEPVEFEGGFKIDAFIELNWKMDDFVRAWDPKLAATFRRVRNALVHSREARMAEVIAPVESNHRKLLPWVNLLSVTAMQVMLLHEV